MEASFAVSTSTSQYTLKPKDRDLAINDVINSSRIDVVYFPWNDPRNVIPYSTYLAVENVCLCWLHNVIALVGVPTNVISCLVFYRQGLRDRMNLCLFSLALVDLLFVTLFYTLGTYCIVGYVTPEMQDWWKWIVRRYVTGVYRAFLYSSGCLTMIIAIERCMCVLYPMKAANLIKTRTMAVIIGNIITALQLLCLIYPLKLTVASVQNALSNATEYKLSVSSLYLNNRQAFDFVENTVIMSVIPFTTYAAVVVSTTVTVVQLKRAMAWRQESTASSNGSSATTSQLLLVKMLVAVSCIYILLTSPNIALGITRSVVAEFAVDRNNSNIFLATHMVYLELSMVNSAINFFVYVSQSSRFRKILRSMTVACALPRRPGRTLTVKSLPRVTVFSDKGNSVQETQTQAGCEVLGAKGGTINF